MIEMRRAVAGAVLVTAAGLGTVVGAATADAAVRTPYTSPAYPSLNACQNARNTISYDSRSSIKLQCEGDGIRWRFRILAR